eukprot:TRINITY_DN38065_c0_g1_i1.p1 TRINITY_DN38065_c0_g1~~TRINITY_DN38065_c0_g1_i1.p1  ORF type:complete len:258 (-),score=58.44 TRINITY_DN38065_c0_g1_i1:119-892(-)
MCIRDRWVTDQTPMTRSNLRLCSQGPSTSHYWPPAGSQVDTLFSFWLMPTSWVRIIFMEPPPTWRTAEDMHISYTIRKYLGRPTYIFKNPRDVNFAGSIDDELALTNRSWVDSVGISANKARVMLPELDAALGGPIQSKVEKRDYNWERDQVLRLLAEKGNGMNRIGWVRRTVLGRAVVLLGPTDLSADTIRRLDHVAANPLESVLVVCRTDDCREWRNSGARAWWLQTLMFGNHQRLMESKVYRCLLYTSPSPRDS